MNGSMHKIVWKKTGTHFFRLLFSYVLFVFLPLILACALFMSVMVANSREKTLDEQQRKLDKGVEWVKWEMEKVTSLNRQLSEDSIISDYDSLRLETSFYDRDVFRRQISLYCGSNELISNLYLCFQEERWMMTPSGPVLSQFYTRDQNDSAGVYNYLTLNGENFLDAIAGKPFGCFFSGERKIATQNSEQVVLYADPVFKQGDSVPLLCVVEMRVTDIARTLINTVDSDNTQSGLLVFDDRDCLVYASDGFSADSKLDSSRETVQLNGKTYAVNSQTMPNVSWKVVLLTDAALLPSITNPTFIRLLVVLAVLILICLVLMTVFMSQHYAPLHDIYTIARQFREEEQNGDKRGGLKNEYQTIHGAMDEMISRVQQYSEKEKTYADILKMNFWTAVLNQKLNSEDEYRNSATEVGVACTGKWCVLLLDYLQSDVDPELLSGALQEKMVGMADCILMDYSPIYQKVCILSIYQDALPELAEIESICSEMIAENNLALMIGIGNVADSFSGIASSCFNAYSAVDACRITGRPVMRYDAAETVVQPSGSSAFIVPEQFRRNIEEENALMVGDELNNMEKRILQSEWSINQIRHICFDLYSVATDTLLRIGKDAVKNSDLLTMIMNIHLQDDALDFIDELNKRITQVLNQKKSVNIQNVVNRLQEEKAFVNPDFSFSVVAQEMGLSNASFTRAFQRTTGKLPMDYLMDMRIRYAQELLVSTEESVMDIAVKAGYYSVSSFSKRFKQMTNMTPKEYRTRYSEGGK